MKNPRARSPLSSCPHRWLRALVCAVALGVLPTPALGQEPSGNPANRNAQLRELRNFADEMKLPSPYTRERFTYPKLGRPDPVVPPPSIAARDESVPTLHLVAVLFDPRNPKLSVAILRVGDKGGKQQRVAEGDRIGQIEVQKIESHRVTLRIHGLGTTRSQVLELTKRAGQP